MSTTAVTELHILKLQEQAALLALTHDGVMVWDRDDGTILLWSRGAEEIYGWTAEEALGKNIDRLLKSAPAENIEALRAGLAAQSHSEGELTQKRKNGTTVLVSTRWQMLSGEPPAVLEVGRDITVQKRVEERFRLVVESAPNGIVMVDQEGRIILVNSQVERLFGYSRQELLGQNIEILVPDRLRSSRPGYRFEFARAPQARPMGAGRDLYGRRKDGSEVPVEIGLNPIRAEGGVFVLASIVDITERKRAEEELRKLNEELEQRVALRTAELARANEDLIRDMEERQRLEEQLRQAHKIESIGTLAGGIAHDFNNLLNIILGYAILLEKSGMGSATQVEALDIIKQTVMRGASVVQQLLTIARRTPVKFEQVDLNETVNALVRLISQTFPKEIEITFLPNPVPPVLADPTQITQALLNICLNARDAMLLGGKIIIRTASVRGRQLKDAFVEADRDFYACLEITDTGAGMDESVRLRIFEPFYTTKGTQGTGLGLAVVYGIVQTHGGFIDVSTEQHKGTTFRLYLPAQTADETTTPSPVPHYHGTEKDGESTKQVVLVVEDENYMLLLVKRLLEAKGYRVLTASDGEQALELHQRHKDELAVIILDLGLPKIPGREVFLKMKETTPDLPVIVASGYLYPEVKAALLKEGARSLLEKPYNPEALLAAVGAAVRLSGRHRRAEHQFLS